MLIGIWGRFLFFETCSADVAESGILVKACHDAYAFQRGPQRPGKAKWPCFIVVIRRFAIVFQTTHEKGAHMALTPSLAYAAEEFAIYYVKIIPKGPRRGKLRRVQVGDRFLVPLVNLWES